MEDISVGSPVYLRNHKRNSKIDLQWLPFYRVVQVHSPLTFSIRNQMNGETTKAHARHLRLADVEEWEIPKAGTGRACRRATMAVSSSDSESDTENDNKTPYQRAIDRKRQERENSSDEENIPLLELRRRIQCRDQTSAKQVRESDNDDVTEIDESKDEHTTDESDTRDVQDMEICTAKIVPTIPSQETGEKEKDSKLLVKNLLAPVHALIKLFKGTHFQYTKLCPLSRGLT